MLQFSRQLNRTRSNESCVWQSCCEHIFVKNRIACSYVQTTEIYVFCFPLNWFQRTGICVNYVRLHFEMFEMFKRTNQRLESVCESDQRVSSSGILNIVYCTPAKQTIISERIPIDIYNQQSSTTLKQSCLFYLLCCVLKVSFFSFLLYRFFQQHFSTTLPILFIDCACMWQRPICVALNNLKK